MAKQKKCKCPEPGLTAPFYMLTYGDLMTLLLTFFVLLFSMSTVQTLKFQAQISVMQGALGISKMYKHAPMQKNLPAPSVAQKVRTISTTENRRPSETPAQEASNVNSQNPTRLEDEERIQAIRSLGVHSKMMTDSNKQEMIITLPTYGIFSKGEYTIDPTNPEVQKVGDLFRLIAIQLAQLTQYDIYFTGHTDSVPLVKRPNGPADNMQLGFLRALSIYDYFFSKDLTDKTRISFASQGDNVPVISNATLDSERRMNRRVEIHLKKNANKRRPGHG